MSGVTDADFDVVTMGRCGVDFYPTEHGSLVEVRQFNKYLGGSPANVAVAAARLGRRSALISRTGADPFGAYIHAALREFGVDDRFVTDVDSLPTPVTFCETFPPDHFPIYFYRRPSAPDLQIHPEELDLETISSARLFWATVSGLSVEPSRGSTLLALRARERRHPTVLDLDFRPVFWSSLDEARQLVPEAARLATVCVGNLEEVEVCVGTRDPELAADRLLDLGCELAVVKMGPAGVLAKSRHERVTGVPVPVEVVNGLGAGDGFGGALCHGILSDWPLQRTIDVANAAGAIVASRLSCSEAMPTMDEIESLLRRDES